MPKLASEFAGHYVRELTALLERLPMAALDRFAAMIEAAHQDDQQIFVIGNGGSATTASHLMNDLCKATLDIESRGLPVARRFRVIALTDNVALLTAWANDFGYDRVFSEPLRNLARRGDLLIAISVSGDSANVLAAVQVARQLGMRVAALTGRAGGQLAAVAEVAVIVPSDNYGQVEDCHLILDHILVGHLRKKLGARTGENDSLSEFCELSEKDVELTGR